MPFKTSENTLENIKKSNDEIVAEELRSFIKENFPKIKEKIIN